jgi:hypothetical protein
MSATTYTGKLSVILNPVMEALSIVKTSSSDTTDATKLLTLSRYGVCSEAIENYILRD